MTGVATLKETINAGSSTTDLGSAQIGSVDLQGNAGELVVHAADATLDQLTASVNAGSLRVTLGSHELAGTLSSNAGQIDLCVPDGVGLHFEVSDNIAFSHNLDERGLSHSGSTWTRDATGGVVTISLQVSGNATSFQLNPEDGCGWRARVTPTAACSSPACG